MTVVSVGDVASVLWSSSLLVPLIALLLFCLLAGYLVYSGIFRPITVETKAAPYGEMTIAYKSNTGAYKNSARMYDEVEKLLPKNSPCVFVGIFYDDPESVPESELRYAVGGLIASGAEEPDPRLLEKMVANGYKITVLPKQNYAVIAAFPLRTALSMYVGIFRVYPKLRSYINAMSLCAYPAIEICTTDSVHFVMPLSRQEEFFVPEFSEEQISVATTEVSCRDLPPDCSAVDEMRRTSSRNSNRRSEERDENYDDDDQSVQVESGEGIFVKPTRPAPKKAKAVSSTSKDISTDSSSMSSSFEDLEGEKFHTKDADEAENRRGVDTQK